MVAYAVDERSTTGTDSYAIAEFARTFPTPGRVRRVGRVRIPLSLTSRPWATLYVLPDGRRWWVIRLWHGDRAHPRVVPTSTLLRYARTNGLASVAHAIEALVERSAGDDVPRP